MLVASLLVASFLLFLLVAVSGNPLATLMANPHISPATIAVARQQLGLNQPLLLRYWTWLTHMLTGNFGTSTTSQPVGPELWSRLGITLRMVIPSVIIAAFIAVIIGVVTAVRQYSILDHTLTGFAYLFYSAPVFVIAILLKDFLAIDVNKAVGHTTLYTIGESTPGVTGAWPTFTNIVGHTVLPVITLVLVTYAGWSRYQRASMLDVLNAEQALVNARVALIVAQHDRVVASYNLLAGVGELNLPKLGLNIPLYDPMVHYEQVRDAWAGVRIPDGR